jgi:hypothetical protein
VWEISQQNIYSLIILSVYFGGKFLRAILLFSERGALHSHPPDLRLDVVAPRDQHPERGVYGTSWQLPAADASRA